MSDEQAGTGHSPGALQPVPQTPAGGPLVPTEDPKRAGCIGSMVAVMGFIAGSIYVLNPTAGLIEFIPDNVPIFGNLDEAGATALVIYSLQYLGRYFRRRSD